MNQVLKSYRSNIKHQVHYIVHHIKIDLGNSYIDVYDIVWSNTYLKILYQTHVLKNHIEESIRYK